MSSEVIVVGAGLAGSECAWQLASRGVRVRLLEQKPTRRTPAQHHDFFAELVCSNSFRGAALSNAVGLLKEEMRQAGSLIMTVGAEAEVPAGGAFAVDRVVFGEAVTARLHAHPLIEVVAGEVREVPAVPDGGAVVLATGPLTGDALAADLGKIVGLEYLAYYDAIAPVVSAESIDWSIAFKASRYDKGGDDAYGNCPLNVEEYAAFVQAVLDAEKVEAKEFEDVRYFEGCLPLEVMAERGPQTLSFGPMKPVGLRDPRTDSRPHAVVQLRQEDTAGTAYNLVGFQTRMKWPDQKRVFRMIPGLQEAEFLRFGSVHRNTFVDSPRVLDDELQLRARPGVYLAGQISGVEGYVESAAAGLVIGARLAAKLSGAPVALPPQETALGSLMRHLRTERDDFQPSNITWAMVPPLPEVDKSTIPKVGGRRRRKVDFKKARREAGARRALAALGPWVASLAPRT